MTGFGASRDYAEKVTRWSSTERWDDEMRKFLAYGKGMAGPSSFRGRILDVGCGAGGASRWARSAGFDYYLGVDVNPHYSYGEVGEGSWTRMYSGARLPYDVSTFEAVMFFHSLAHMPFPAEAIREAVRVLRPGGWIGVATPNHSFTCWRTVLGGPEPDQTAHSPFYADTLTDLLAKTTKRRPHVHLTGDRLLGFGPHCRLHAWVKV